VKRSKRMLRILRNQWAVSSGDNRLRNHLSPAEMSPPSAPLILPIIKLSVPFQNIKLILPLAIGLGGRHLLAYRAFGLILITLVAAGVFWKLAKHEGPVFRTIAGTLVLVTVWQAWGLASTVITDCNPDLPSWLWWLAGCWYL
jgi:hypothetical protein